MTQTRTRIMIQRTSGHLLYDIYYLVDIHLSFIEKENFMMYMVVDIYGLLFLEQCVHGG